MENYKITVIGENRFGFFTETTYTTSEAAANKAAADYTYIYKRSLIHDLSITEKSTGFVRHIKTHSTKVRR